MFGTVVIGAGLAGLACARILEQEGRNVVILKAGDEVGGRVHTDKAESSLTNGSIEGAIVSGERAAADILRDRGSSRVSS